MSVVGFIYYYKLVIYRQDRNSIYHLYTEVFSRKKNVPKHAMTITATLPVNTFLDSILLRS